VRGSKTLVGEKTWSLVGAVGGRETFLLAVPFHSLPIVPPNWIILVVVLSTVSLERLFTF
jgi:hypothetical protein